MRLRGRCIAAVVCAAIALPAAAVDVTLSKRLCDCDGTDGPRDHEERRKTDYRWLDDGRLELQVWADETADSPIDETRPMADWYDGVLVLTHWNRSVKVDFSRTPACLFAVRLTYTVSGLARGSLRVHASPAPTVTVSGD